jgi:hypothetical protein
VLWRNGGLLQNDATPGVQPKDYDVWRANFGRTSGTDGAVDTIGGGSSMSAALDDNATMPGPLAALKAPEIDLLAMAVETE